MYLLRKVFYFSVFAIVVDSLFHWAYVQLDNPIAQNLLIKQLQRHHLEVVATSNGEEAIAGMFHVIVVVIAFFKGLSIEWEAHEPGFFSVALFDHRKSSSNLFCTRISKLKTPYISDMPICDGVEAAKRLRHLERKNNVSVILPSTRSCLQFSFTMY